MARTKAKKTPTKKPATKKAPTKKVAKAPRPDYVKNADWIAARVSGHLEFQGISKTKAAVKLAIDNSPDIQSIIGACPDTTVKSRREALQQISANEAFIEQVKRVVLPVKAGGGAAPVFRDSADFCVDILLANWPDDGDDQFLSTILNLIAYRYVGNLGGNRKVARDKQVKAWLDEYDMTLE